MFEALGQLERFIFYILILVTMVIIYLILQELKEIRKESAESAKSRRLISGINQILQDENLQDDDDSIDIDDEACSRCGRELYSYSIKHSVGDELLCYDCYQKYLDIQKSK